jgi:hypothetical protein
MSPLFIFSQNLSSLIIGGLRRSSKPAVDVDDIYVPIDRVIRTRQANCAEPRLAFQLSGSDN